ncbi:MAG: OmpA family protein [Myxococcales bacterium]
MSSKTLVSLSAVLAWSLSASALGAKPLADHESCKDPAVFTRMPGFFLPNASRCETRQFDRYEFPLADRQKAAVEGAFAKYRYTFDKTAGAPPSALQVLRNYENAVKAAGGETLFEDPKARVATLRLTKADKEIWAWVHMGMATDYDVILVEKQAMRQDVTANAAALGSGLAGTGHVEVPGIFFDTGKSEIKPESEASLGEVAKLLQQDASLKVWVVGHTDSVGSPESNLTLSNARAAAVVKALVDKHGIAAPRLGSFGAGPYAPTASNASDDGRAKNRRVELVARP